MKKFINIFFEAIQGVISYRLRTFLSVFAIGLGIAAVTLVVAVVNGAYKSVTELIGTFGPDTVMVFGGGRNVAGHGFRSMTITVEDVQAVKDAFPTAYSVHPFLPSAGTRISYRDKHHRAFVIGTPTAYTDMESWELVSGRDILPVDQESAANVCVLGDTVKRTLFDESDDPIGKYVKVNSFYCQVIGVLKPVSLMGMRGDMNDRFIMPMSSVMKRISGQYKHIMMLRVSFEDIGNLKQRAEELESFLRMRHNIADDQDSDFMIISPDMIMKFFLAVSGAIMVFIGIMTLLTVSVGGFVMANMFLISVQERTKEIGIRRAFGATKSDIFRQFILEFGIITVLGALIGFVLGALGAKAVSGFGIFTAEISLGVFFAALAVSILIAAVFGTAPAGRAASVNPIDAIRSR
ncbi:FtsX-like permease family protein [Geovibrio thiophilus]|uniref:FtsX-like permease family protein n=1 Tax=Geovibrio thiophilus TaxID=139438 RepID=A0A3R5X2R5_9BACT|nr:ABC transporter permease [Geovibrio thiophilus]QAR33111.1 FtsX-like permease family protein [Geovibrio thiophilus]